VSTASEKLRWEGTPLYAHDVKAAAGCSGVFVALVALGALVHALLEPAPYFWPVPLAAGLFGLTLVGLVIRCGRRRRYRITTGALTVETLHATTRYLIPRDVVLSVRESHDRSVHLGELPAEVRDSRGVRHTTEPLLLTGLGPDAAAILGALEAAKTDGCYPPATVEGTRHVPRHVTELCASRSAIPLAAFVSSMPAEVPPGVARAVRGCIARMCSVPVDHVAPGDSVRAYMRKRDYVDFTSFVIALEGALGEKVGAGVLDEEGWLDQSVVELALAVSRGLRTTGARRER
jgi:hypothetical protein